VAGHAEELQRQARAAQAALERAVRKAEEARTQATAELASQTVRLEEEVRRGVKAGTAEVTRGYEARLAAARNDAIAEAEEALDRAASVPIGLRIGALVIDLVLVAATATTVRMATPWGGRLSLENFVLAAFALLSFRAFASPGGLLLGVSATRIGPALRPVGRVGLRRRLACGLLHYGPLLATGFVAVTDPPTVRALGKLGEWLREAGASPEPLGTILLELFRPSSPDLPAVVLMATLVWWSLLLLSLLVSASIHPGSPYFRSTTLVESMWRVGFRRFIPPSLDDAADSPASPAAVAS
jgi:hypothetical protein